MSRLRVGDLPWLVVAGVAGVLMLTSIAPRAAGQGLGDEIKAEFIERFTRFIEWPASSSVADTSVPFVIGIVGDSPIRSPLQQMAERGRIKGKRVEVRTYSGAAGIGDCQVLFISGSERGQLDEILGRVQGKPVLTVGDTEGFGGRKVMINFTLEGDFVRFEVNQAAAERSGFKLADQLLALGKKIG